MVSAALALFTLDEVVVAAAVISAVTSIVVNTVVWARTVVVDVKSDAPCVGGTMAVPVPFAEDAFESSLATVEAAAVPGAGSTVGCGAPEIPVTVAGDGDGDVSDTIPLPMVFVVTRSVPFCVAIAVMSASEAETVVVTVVSDTTEASAVVDVAACVKKLKSLVLPAPTPTAGTFPFSDPLLVEGVSELELAPVALGAAAAIVVVIVSKDSVAPGADGVAAAV